MELGPPWTVAEADDAWWYNRRATGGFRLTDQGAEVMIEQLKREAYRIKLTPDDIAPKMLLELDRKLTSPYYLMFKGHRPDWLILFGSQDATMAMLCDDLKLFVKNLDNRPKPC